MTNNIAVGPIRLGLLDGTGTRIATYYLPAPDSGNGLTLEWVEKNTAVELIDGSEAVRRLGYLPELNVSWSVYDDKNALYGYSIGSGNGQQLDFVSLLALLDNAPGYISVSPGLTTGGFIPSDWTISSYSVIPGSFATNLSIKFRGCSVFSTKVLSTF